MVRPERVTADVCPGKIGRIDRHDMAYAGHGELMPDRSADRAVSEEEDCLRTEFLLPRILSSPMNPFRIYALDLHSIRIGVG